MFWYFIKRILLIIPIVLAIILVIFILLYALPGSSPRNLESYKDGDVLDSVFKFFNLSDSFFTKYIRYCYEVFTGLNFGSSSQNSLNVQDELRQRVNLTLTLSGLSLAATLLLGIPAGIYAAVHQNKWQDNIITFFTVLLSSIPIYILALMMVLLFSLALGWLPSFGFREPTSLILPTVSLSVGGIAAVARMTRSSMLSVLDQQYITTLRSKGLKERSVVYCHALKNLLVPVISVLNTLAAQLLCGALVVERFFSIPGVGFYLVESISKRNSNALLGSTVIIAIMLSLVSVIADILYAFVNPQFKLQYTKGSFAKPGKSGEYEI